ncbi:HipA N-terminal domain-containing protein [Muricauda lutimaris]|uniref:HipA N-terminal domain-containing protein n=1 Tax=Flagellimonas profundi TaxID=2915620 RepID=A0ABS3FAK3_9FLAO|nr:HipA N-terminal domain-containing protein [Allomuricauda profundi]
MHYKGQWTGILALDNHGHYTFRYTEDWLRDGNKPPISLTLAKSTEAYRSDHFFPFFYNILLEAANKQLVCKITRIDAEGYFGTNRDMVRLPLFSHNWIFKSSLGPKTNFGTTQTSLW